MANETDRGAYYASAIHSILADSTSTVFRKCELVSLLVCDLVQNEEIDSLDSIVVLLPSIVHLLNIAPHSANKEELNRAIQQRFFTADLARLHSLLLNDSSFAASLLQTQEQLEQTWFHDRTNAESRAYDAVGTHIQSRDQLEKELQTRSSAFSPAESLAIDKSILATLLSEVRRLMILSEMQASALVQSESGALILDPYFTSFPAGFRSIFGSKMSNSSQAALSYLIQGLNSITNAEKTNRMDSDIPTAFPLSLPCDMKKLVVSLLQAESGASMAHYLLVNSFAIQSNTSSPTADSSDLGDILTTLVDYAHIIRSPDPMRSLLPNLSGLKGPFTGGSGFPRILPHLQSEPDLSSLRQLKPLPGFALGAQDSTESIRNEPQPTEVLIAKNIESVLEKTIHSIFMGPASLLQNNGLVSASKRLLERLESVRLFPHLQALLVFGSSAHTTSPFTRAQLEWIRAIATSKDAPRRADWKRFLHCDPRRSALLAKLWTSPTRLISSELDLSVVSAPEIEAETLQIRNWLEVLALSLAAFQLTCNAQVLTSLLEASQLLVSIANLPTTPQRVLGEAIHFLTCSIALLAFPTAAITTSASSEPNFSIFASLFQLLSVVSNAASLAKLPEIGFLRLAQLLHHLKRVDLLTQCLEVALGVPISASWLKSGISHSFTVTPASSASTAPISSNAMDITPESARGSETNAQPQKSMRVNFTQAWIWASPIGPTTHLTLTHLYHAASSPIPGPTLLSIFEGDDILPTPLSLSVHKHLSNAVKQSAIPEDGAMGGVPDRWSAVHDVWLQWIILRLLLALNPSEDLDRFNATYSAPSNRGNQEGVAECLWKLCERTSHFVASASPRFVRPLRSIALETIYKYAELCTDGFQRFWSFELLKSAFHQNHFADLTQSFSASPNSEASTTPSSSIICLFGPQSVHQALLLCGYIFVKSPALFRGSMASTSAYAAFATANNASEGPTSEGEASGLVMKKPELLTWIARHTGVTLPNMTSTYSMSNERKKRLTSHLKAQLCLDFVGSPSNVLQLCRALLVELVLPDSVPSASATMNHVPGISGAPLRVNIALLDLLKKSPFTVFPHLPHFSHLVQLAPSKTIRTFVPQPLVQVDFGFLRASDYRSVIAERPFLATLDFVSMNDLSKLETYILESMRRLAGTEANHSDEKSFAAVLAWAYARVSLERTMQACSFALLQPNFIPGNHSLSHAIDAQHEQLLNNPRLLFGFDLGLLKRSSLFNFVFYTIVSYYGCLAKVDISSVIDSTHTSELSALAANDSEDENDSKDEEEADESDEMRLSGSTTRSANGETSDAPSTESTSPRGSALTDPFHLRAMKSLKAHGGHVTKHVSFLSGEQKMSPNDADLLKHLEDSALVLMLIDLLLFVEDMPETGGIELGTKHELRTGICDFLQQLFVNDGPLMNVVHQQGYPSRALPLLVDGVPAMHFCLELAPPMLSHSFQRFASSDSPPPSVAFSVQMTAWVVKRYPTPRSLEMAGYIFELYRSVGRSLHPALWRSTLPDLARMVLAFPSLAPGLVELVQINSGANVVHSLLATQHTAMDLPNPLMNHPSNGSPISSQSGASFSRTILQDLFSVLAKGQSIAPYLKE